MELRKIIADLYQERAKLDRVIAGLEELAAQDLVALSHAKSRRGRKYMNPEERQQVSERMRRYWAARKAAQNPEQQSLIMGAASAA